MELILRSLAALAFVLVLAELFLRRWYKLTNATFVWPPRGRIRLEIDRENLPNLDPVARIEFNRDGELMARFFFVQDPDGYKIEVLEKHGRYV